MSNDAPRDGDAERLAREIAPPSHYGSDLWRRISSEFAARDAALREARAAAAAEQSLTKFYRAKLDDARARIAALEVEEAHNRIRALADQPHPETQPPAMTGGKPRGHAELEEAIAALDAAPDDAGWRPDRPGWYWIREYEDGKWRPAEYLRMRLKGFGKGVPEWRGMPCGPFEIGPYIPSPAPCPREAAMRCETCHGKGVCLRDGLPAVAVMPGDPARVVSVWEPCPECGGTGITHCCEGLREQPAPEANGDG